MTNTVLQHLISDNCRKYFVHKPKVFKKNWAIERDDQTYKDTGRVYKVDDKIYPSITTICKILTEKYIEQWEQQVGKQEAERIRNLAARRGTKIHQLCEDYVQGNHIDCQEYNLSETSLFAGIKQVLDDRLSEVFCSETQLYSDYLALAGTTDVVGMFDNKKSVIDFKNTFNDKYKDQIEHYFIQATSYAIMFEERTNIPISQIVVIVASDDTSKPTVYVEKRDNYVKQLLETRQIFRQRYNL